MAVVVAVLCGATAYKPVFFMHGITGSYHDFDVMVQWLQAVHPGTPTFALNIFNNDDSFGPLYEQIAGVFELINQTLIANGFSSFHLVCHSQGALICRTMLQTFNHTADTFISMSGPQMGQFALAGQGDWFMRKFPNITTEIAWIYLYEAKVQARYSPANYWRDPHHEPAFLRDVIFLPVLNNETTNPRSQEFKSNFLKLSTVCLYGSPDDGVIVPWQSALFGFWGPDGEKTMVPMANQTLYTEDWIGLRKLNETGRLLSVVVPGAQHSDWLTRTDLFEKYIGPFLN